MLNLQNLYPLIKKHNLNGPRYTSYPTALELKLDVNKPAILENIKTGQGELSIYMHIPFCKKLCYYCGCHKQIARNTDKSDPYVEQLKQEIKIWAEEFKAYSVKQIHFGGGTPTFLANHQLIALVNEVKNNFEMVGDIELNIEVDPRTVNGERLEDLIKLGFNRFSFGIQDFSQETQIAINRVQSLEQIEEIVAVMNKYQEVTYNLDLIYGLPYQTEFSFKQTLDKVITLAPDRISLFNYAHLPARFPEQNKIKNVTLPNSEVKLAIQLMAIETLSDAGYVYIGIDHFAKPEDKLAKALAEGKLHRNFQGYTTHGNQALLGLGVSSISQIGDVMFQNTKSLTEYASQIDEGKAPIISNMFKNQDDKIRAEVIKDLLCNLEVNLKEIERKYNIEDRKYFESEIEALAKFTQDNLVEVNEDKLVRIKREGRFFARSIASVFDIYLNKSNQAKFSKVI
ncbi:oxygen-independent coproporphyrinogen III oxidase [Catenovulum maritimum]|uniref:Coproporphyrinogen-III oxidase n=1 Tax=Catenovulum maritimum TaxID=1513271 RepID=A0A0J8GT88_9ALTE|nr:oxygen-independent coproporphyrinogen III oxidase [Catenovulum maritimum]KMT65967.1 hypothetical protein XM47_05790 [Catenovulum maritimum]